jgi:hypothetical protein
MPEYNWNTKATGNEEAIVTVQQRVKKAAVGLTQDVDTRPVGSPLQYIETKETFTVKTLYEFVDRHVERFLSRELAAWNNFQALEAVNTPAYTLSISDKGNRKRKDVLSRTDSRKVTDFDETHVALEWEPAFWNAHVKNDDSRVCCVKRANHSLFMMAGVAVQPEDPTESEPVEASLAATGCSWTGALSGLAAHKGVCKFERVQCEQPGCDEMIPRGEKTAHEEECPHRLVTCGNDGCSKKDVVADMVLHSLSCDYRTLVCPDGCGASLKGWQKDAHGRTCPAKRIPCECASLGCREEVKLGLGRIVALYCHASTLYQIR